MLPMYLRVQNFQNPQMMRMAIEQYGQHASSLQASYMGTGHSATAVPHSPFVPSSLVQSTAHCATDDVYEKGAHSHPDDGCGYEAFQSAAYGGGSYNKRDMDVAAAALSTEDLRRLLAEREKKESSSHQKEGRQDDDQTSREYKFRPHSRKRRNRWQDYDASHVKEASRDPLRLTVREVHGDSPHRDMPKRKALS